MANQINVAGLVTISVGTGNANALETLGYTENGVEIQENVFCYDVHGDENGGDAGPPIDIQMMGQMDVIRMTLTKWDETIMVKLRAAIKGGTAGTVPTAGQLFFQGSLSWRLVLNAVTAAFDRDYVNTIIREAKEVNAGTKHSKQVLVMHAYKNAAGLLWDTTVT